MRFFKYELPYQYEKYRDKFCLTIVAWLPKRILYWAFIRVYAADGTGPGLDYKAKAEYWSKNYLGE